jgi:hypothetical protein
MAAGRNCFVALRGGGQTAGSQNLRIQQERQGSRVLEKANHFSAYVRGDIRTNTIEGDFSTRWCARRG